MNEALIADRSGVEAATTINNRFAHHADVQVPVQMAMSVDHGPTPLEVSGYSAHTTPRILYLISESSILLPYEFSGFRSPPPFRWTGGQWEVVGTDSQVYFFGLD